MMDGNYLKAISETEDELRVANYIVLYGGRDMEGIASPHVNADGTKGQYFEPDTEFESPFVKSGQVFVDWQHGQETMEGAPKRDDILGRVDWSTAKSDKIGLWVERVLDRRNRYMRYIETLIKEKLIGNSSEAVAEDVQVESNGKIARWPIRRDTLTVTPMEPRMMTQNALSALKSLAVDNPSLKALIPQGAGEAPESATAETDPPQKSTTLKDSRATKMTDITMSADEYKELIRKSVMVEKAPPAVPDPVAQDPAVKALQDQLAHLTDIIEKSPVLKDAGYVAPDSEEDDANVKSFGDFLVAVKNRNVGRLKSVYKTFFDNDDGKKTALAEGAGATGGYVVPTQFTQPIMAAALPYSVVRASGATVVPMTGRTAQVPALDIETAPSAGDTAFAGGVVMYWTEEAATMTESEPRFRLIELVAHKLAGYSLASNEVRADAAVSIESVLTTMFGRAIGATENYAFLRGDGVGKPFGILNSGALIAATRSAASAVAIDDLGEMMSNLLPSSYGSAVWYVNPDVIQKLIGLVSSPLAWMDNIRDAKMPARLLGMPLYVTGALPALNTAGDILLVDPTYYLIGDRQNITIAYSEHVKFLEDQGAWRVTHRVDGQPWMSTYVTLENASTTVSPFCSLAAG